MLVIIDYVGKKGIKVYKKAYNHRYKTCMMQKNSSID